MSKEDFIKLSRILYKFNQFADDICELFNSSEVPIDKPISDLYDWMLYQLGYTDEMLYAIDPQVCEVIYEDCSDEVLGEYYDKAIAEISEFSLQSQTDPV